MHRVNYIGTPRGNERPEHEAQVDVITSLRHLRRFLRLPRIATEDTEDVVTPGRFELPTRSLGNCCSIHLSYGATLESLTYMVHSTPGPPSVASLCCAFKRLFLVGHPP